MEGEVVLFKGGFFWKEVDMWQTIILYEHSCPLLRKHRIRILFVLSV